MLLVGNRNRCLVLFILCYMLLFYKDLLVAEQNNYAAKTVHTCVVYDLDTWPRNPVNNFTLQNCLFEASIIVKNSDKTMWVYKGYGIAFDDAGSWSFGKCFTRNVVIFVDDNS